MSGHPVILVVDDQPDVRDALELWLSGNDYPVITADVPQAALDLVRRGASDFLEKSWDNNRLLTILKM